MAYPAVSNFQISEKSKSPVIYFADIYIGTPRVKNFVINSSRDGRYDIFVTYIHREI